MKEPDPARLALATDLAARATEPAVAGNVLFGTAGWTDPSLVKGGLFYPRGTGTSAGRLIHYAKHFSLVEVDATYYTVPDPSVARAWLERTPPEFRFDVKAHPIVTGHPIDVSRLPSDLRERAARPEGSASKVYRDDLPTDVGDEIEARFFAFLEPLVEAGRLGSVLVQFPPWFHATTRSARRIEEIAERFGPVPIAVEFRHRSWLEPDRRERVFALLRSVKAAYVVVDEPDVPSGGVPPAVAVTNPELAVVRFHGHNVSGWRRGAPVSERFDYLYAPNELAAWTSTLKRLGGEARTVHAVFNNCVRNYAIVGAKGLQVLLTEPGG